MAFDYPKHIEENVNITPANVQCVESIIKYLIDNASTRFNKYPVEIWGKTLRLCIWGEDEARSVAEVLSNKLKDFKQQQ